MSTNKTNSSIVIKRRISETLSEQCRICGAPAKFSHYGTLTCEPCKIFFKRNANAEQAKLVCCRVGQCDINENNRHLCPACRLAKCFRCGMTTDKFRSSRSTTAKSQDLTIVQYKSKRLPTLNLLQADRSLLTKDQWALLTNLYHCYQESAMSPFIQLLIKEHNTVQFSHSIYDTLVEKFLVSVYEAAGAYVRSNDDLRKLSIEDRSVILRSAAENVCCMGGAFIMQHSYLHDLDAFLNSMIRKYGKRTMDIHTWAKKFIDSDILLVKLSMSLFAFSENTGCYYFCAENDLTNPINIFEVQSNYAEITWKYLLYRYTHEEAVKRFLNVTLWLCSMNILASHAQNLPVHINDIGSIVELTEMTLILDDADQIMEAE